MNRIIPDLPAAEYHRHPAVSKHGLDDFRKAPALYRWNRDNPRETTTPALLFGSLYHTVVLEPHRVAAEYHVMPVVDRRTKDGKAAWEQAMAEAAGKQQIKPDDIAKALAMREALMRHPAARAAVEDQRQHVEASMFWTDPTTGVECRGRPDIIRTDGMLIDPKTCQDASPEAFTRAAFNYGYHRQAAFYMAGLEAITGEKPRAFVFVAQESEPPFLTAVYVASPQMIELGRKELAEDLDRFAHCLHNNTWPGLPDKPQELTLPTWVKIPEAA